MNRTKLILPLSLGAALTVAALSPAAINTLQGTSTPVAVKAAPGAPGESNKCPYPPNRPTMTLQASPTTLSKANTVNGSGKLKSNCGVRNRGVGVYKQSSGSSWSLVATTVTDKDGNYAFSVKVSKTSSFKAVFAGDDVFPAAQSNTVTVSVG